MYKGLIERYRDRLPVDASTPVISLSEGNTPLIELQNVPRLVGENVRIFAKFDGLNPTGSFKDRGMTMAVTKAVEGGARAIICASTGNTSASAAAYAARAKIACFVLIPEGKIALGKLSQAMMHGSVVIQIRGNFDDGMRLVQLAAESMGVALVNSINPFRPQGQKTIAFEIVEALGDAPDYHALAGGQCGQYRRALGGLQRSGVHRDERLRVLQRQVSVSPREDRDPASGDARLSGLRRGADRARQTCRKSGNRRDGDTHRQSRLLGPRA